MSERRFVVLDRDGTIITERHYLSDPDQVELIPGVAPALRELRNMGFGLIVLTNQSGVGRGFFTTQQVKQIHERMCVLLHAEGVELDGVFYCPHTPEDACSCRKPALGLMEQAAGRLRFDPRASVVIGDKVCDITLGKRVGAMTILVRTGYGSQMEEACQGLADHCVDHVGAALPLIQQWAGCSDVSILSASTTDLVVLCGGRGTRLGSLTTQIPKPLLKIGGQPFLWHLLSWMKRQGFQRVFLSAHHLAEQFQAFAATQDLIPHLQVIVEPEPLGTGGALRLAADHVNSSTFVAMNGDTWLPQPLAPVFEAHTRAGRQLTAVVVGAEQVEGGAVNKGTWDVGRDGTAAGFVTRPAAEHGWINGGVYVMDRQLVQSWPRGSYSLEGEMVSLVKGASAGVFRSEARLLDIGTPELLACAEQHLLQLHGAATA